MKHFREVLIWLIVVIMLSACSPTLTLIKDTSTPEIMADCFRYFYISTWNDLDENKVWDSSEPPLEGVEFHIDGRFALVLREYPCFSNENGHCTIETWAPGFRDEAEYNIWAIYPENLDPTTPPTITVTLDATDTSPELHFGLGIFLDS